VPSALISTILVFEVLSDEYDPATSLLLMAHPHNGHKDMAAKAKLTIRTDEPLATISLAAVRADI
jgi:hypothetical protein